MSVFNTLAPTPCCCDCEIVVDPFNPSDGFSTWTGDTGSFTENTGILSPYLTASVANKRIINNATTSTPTMTVRVALGGAAGSYLRVIAAYEDANNYLFAELLTADDGECGTLKLYKRVAGVETEIANAGTIRFIDVTGFDDSSWYTWIRICYDADADTFEAAWYSFDGNHRYTKATSVVVNAGANKAGIATGGTIAGTVTFRDFRIIKHESEDPLCVDCDICPTLTGVSTMYMEPAYGAGCEWEVISGTWDLTNYPIYSDYELPRRHIETKSSNAILLSKIRVRPPTADTPYSWYAKPEIRIPWPNPYEFSNIGDVLKLIFDYVDTNNYQYVKIENADDAYGNDKNTYALVRRVAGVDTQVGSATTPRITTIMPFGLSPTVMFDGTNATVYFPGYFGTDYDSFTVRSPTLGGVRVGVGTGSLVSAVDTVGFNYPSLGCEFTSVTCMCDETPPSELTLVIPTLTAGCVECPDFDGTYSMQRSALPHNWWPDSGRWWPEPARPMCYWYHRRGMVSGFCWDWATIWVQLLEIEGDLNNATLIVEARWYFIETEWFWMRWQTTLARPVDCSAWSGLSVPFVNQGLSSIGAYADAACLEPIGNVTITAV